MRIRSLLCELLDRALELQDVFDVGKDLSATVAIILQGDIQHLNLLALLVAAMLVGYSAL